MEKLKSFIISFILLIAVFSSNLHAEDNQSLGRFRIRLDDQSCFEGKQGMLTSDSLISLSPDGNSVSFSRDDIRSLELYKGTGKKWGALIGSLIGVAIAVPVSLEKHETHYYHYQYIEPSTDTEFKADRCILISGAGFFAGLFIGSRIKVWKPMSVRADLDLQASGRSGFIILRLSF